MIFDCKRCGNIEEWRKVKSFNTQCNLEKIFRTPKDMSKVNFDHFEIVERSGLFDSSSEPPLSTGSSPSSETNSKTGSNVANAQVLVRFGDHHNMFYPPQRYFSHPQFYHPYPPPVPYSFPNYYFGSYPPEPHFLAPQLKEYFWRHPEFFPQDGDRLHQVFFKGRPLKKDDLTTVHIVKNPNNFLKSRSTVETIKTVDEENNNPKIHHVEIIKEALKTFRAPSPFNQTNERPMKHDLDDLITILLAMVSPKEATLIQNKLKDTSNNNMEICQGTDEISLMPVGSIDLKLASGSKFSPEFCPKCGNKCLQDAFCDKCGQLL
ncbi:hypothetical protein ABEB36_007892 [Hypothenemus hampei]|uniref:Uncharacterized protein n=1 Tax=Hypothenemus hampei TaxID=57062 RepID=A0ABD1EXZ6_HYPHA